MNPIKLRHAAILTCLLALSACGTEDTEVTAETKVSDVIAQANHNFNGGSELFSYRAKPSEGLGQAEKLAKKQYGGLLSKIKSPSTMFMCVWRTPRRGKLKSDRPAEIFLSCNFALKPVKNPKSLIEMTKTYYTIDRASLKANWKLKNGSYLLSRFEVEIQANQESFRSQNLATDMQQLQVVQDKMNFPENAKAPFQFNLRSQLPFRRDSGGKQSSPIVSVSFSGSAEPIPTWLNY